MRPPGAGRETDMRKQIESALVSAAMGAAMWALGGTAQADQISVEMDKARTLSLAGQAANVIVGNPLIADAGILDRQTLVITGKSYGLTNLIALDAEGRTIYSADLVVTEAEAPQTALVSLHRGSERHSYACAGGGACTSQPMIGDSSDAYQTLTDQRASKLAASHAEAGE